MDIDAPEFGLCRFIIEFVSFAGHEDDHARLETLTDKHLFRDDTISSAASKANFRIVRLGNVSAPEFYADWMIHFMDTYGIRHQELRRAAMRQYERLRGIAGPLLPQLLSHFKYIVLSKNRIRME